ncbi:hypothetical protein LMG26858_03158 [Achromobacter anxifer]|uniref:Uncharacterized protein n=1 Tax=Achromobacter anxifer TaxID=1287737 RepID=A0A6S7DWS9_9BURK|nr:hypothetical protein [Achromobacter anxifer]CAB3879646.1 hypothetical protein LMG26858_03158 [Achromobacter anxifer]
MLEPVLAPWALTGRLWLRFWPQLMALVLAGALARDVLLWVAAQTGFVNHLAGLAVLTLVALAQLVTTVAMFLVLLPGLPALREAQAAARGGDAAGDGAQGRLGQALTVALLPFFAYYAAWGFLGDIVRQYSRLAYGLDPLGEHGNVLDALDSRWLIVSVAISWLVRKAAVMARDRTGKGRWQWLVVLCETNWILIGLYVISRWKDQAWQWLADRRGLDALWQSLINMVTPISNAWAAGMTPAEAQGPGWGATLVSQFFYALLPVLWLVMAALVYGYDVREDAELRRYQRLERFGERYRAVPRFLRDFVEHFIAGYRKRYLPLASGVRLAFHSGALLLVTLIVGYRLIDWGAAWLWYGAARLIGPHDLDTWQLLAHGVSLLFGSPFRDSSTGLLIEPLRICFLAAVLECAYAPWKMRSPASAPAA